MAKYTTQIRSICESVSGLDESVGYDGITTIIQNALPKIFNFSFPIFDETYRTFLETKIIKHYYTREIGLETYGLWKLKLDAKLNEIMPYYNQFYRSELLTFNPFYDVDLTTDHKLTKNETADQTGHIVTADNVDITENSNSENDLTSTINNTSGSTSDATNTNTKTHFDKYSDTPQGALTNVENGSYLTNARLINDTDSLANHSTVTGADESNSNSNSTLTSDSESSSKRDTTINNTSNRDINTVDDYLQHVKGKNGGSSYSALLNEYRSTFLNIDMQVINELSDLFLNLW